MFWRNCNHIDYNELVWNLDLHRHPDHTTDVYQAYRAFMCSVVTT